MNLRISNNARQLILLPLVVLSEIKSIWYQTLDKVNCSIFGNKTEYIDLVVGEYVNSICFSVFIFIALLPNNNEKTRQILLLYLIISILDIIFLILFYGNYFMVKLGIAMIVYLYGKNRVFF